MAWWRPREPFNSYSHLAGVVLGLAGLAAMLALAEGRRRLVGLAIYGASLVALYAASTLYHWLKVSPRVQDWLRRVDHMAIFGLIAGTYTPVCLVTLGGPTGWWLLGAVWGLAAVGMGMKVVAGHLPPLATAAVYAGMGWLGVVVLGPLVRALPWHGIAWLVAGGVAYTAGAVVYGLRRPDPLPGVVGHHGVFHVCVLAGSALHFVFMATHVLPAG